MGVLFYQLDTNVYWVEIATLFITWTGKLIMRNICKHNKFHNFDVWCNTFSSYGSIQFLKLMHIYIVIYEHYLIFKLRVIYYTKVKWLVIACINIMLYQNSWPLILYHINTSNITNMQIKMSDSIVYTILHIIIFYNMWCK